MAGTSIGCASGLLIGMRVAGPGQYIPAHIKNGQEISACLRLTGFINRQDGRTDRYALTLWGKLADAGAKSLSPGKEFHVPICTPQSYEGRVFDDNRQPILKPDGQPITVWKTNFVVNSLIFGSDSENHIAKEIADGKRPAAWRRGEAQHETWRQILIQRQATTYMGGNTFGYANVIIPQGAQLKLGTPAAAPVYNQPAPGFGQPAPVYNQAPVYGNPAVNPGMVNQAVTNMAGNMGTVPGTYIDPNTGQPMYTNPGFAPVNTTQPVSAPATGVQLF